MWFVYITTSSITSLLSLTGVVCCILRYPPIINYSRVGFAYFTYDMVAMYKSFAATPAISQLSVLGRFKAFAGKRTSGLAHHICLAFFCIPFVAVSGTVRHGVWLCASPFLCSAIAVDNLYWSIMNAAKSGVKVAFPLHAHVTDHGLWVITWNATILPSACYIPLWRTFTQSMRMSVCSDMGVCLKLHITRHFWCDVGRMTTLHLLLTACVRGCLQLLFVTKSLRLWCLFLQFVIYDKGHLVLAVVILHEASTPFLTAYLAMKQVSFWYPSATSWQ